MANPPRDTVATPSPPACPPPSLKVIGAGFGRTGTKSLQAALEILLGAPCYHMETIVQPNAVAGLAGDLAAWEAVASTGRSPDWRSLFDARGVAATVDFPVCLYYAELASAYPDAKVILSVRPAADWFRSWAALTATIPQFAWLCPVVPRFRRVVAMITALIFAPVFDAPRIADGVPMDEATCITEYERHNAEVVATIPPERLLVYHLGDGWAPLCDFLGLPVPSVPYPHQNKRRDLSNRSGAGLVALAVVDKWRWVVGAGAAVAVVGVALALLRVQERR
ncbi:hypothetical protein BU14_0025s0047 [Porphyra umbilicalis]|uniref:Sulfotransferase domain-containing protein n=1 Tax=Porphyra umbilicalis TaxID=2786 RepID=A0A1X6PK79_PORUM|nr:hypothetical protein BU14_0025s0047 [Porphyra umbilicalis]|eukprot:OSX81166.1 hypothetical protein BU14_0025s0047 [Porphyra umbilicalis]